MKPEEMRDDIPEDVREALAELCETYGGNPLREVVDKIETIIRAKPATVRMPAAEIPAPLEEAPVGVGVWTVAGALENGIEAISGDRVSGDRASRAVALGLAWDTKEKALAALAAFTARETTRPGEDWTPHTPGDPMPCDEEAVVDVRFRDGSGVHCCPARCHGWQRLDDDRPHDFDIIAWRYAREGEG